jgi:hypothetical protein
LLGPKEHAERLPARLRVVAYLVVQSGSPIDLLSGLTFAGGGGGSGRLGYCLCSRCWCIFAISAFDVVQSGGKRRVKLKMNGLAARTWCCSD